VSTKKDVVALKASKKSK
jgi:hypothetical protein